MFKRPKSNEIKHFFEFHPIQDFNKTEQQPFNYKKTFFRPDGGLRYWLTYNENKKSFFCSVCLAFARSNDESKFISGMNDFKHLYCRINDHENSRNHYYCVDTYMMHTKEKSIDVLLFKNQLTKRMQEVEHRRMIFQRIVDVIKLIGKRGLSFRGAYESAKDLANPNVSHGNFLDILLLLAKYDAPLDEHIKLVIKKASDNKTPGRSQNVTLLSKTLANYVIKSISILIKKQISEDIKMSGMYSIQIDTSQDVSVSDICSIIVRYVSSTYKSGVEPAIHERALSFLNPKKTTGQALCDLISNNLSDNSIDVKKCIGSSTDGASNMIGQYNGFSKWLEKESPKQLHVWCYAHCLNLVIIEATGVSTPAISLFGLLNSCAAFFRDSHKRMDLWRDLSSDTRVLNLIGQTRWWSKDAALKKMFGSFNEPSHSLYITVIKIFSIISSNNEDFNNDCRCTAMSLLQSLTKFETILTAQLYLKIFQRTTPLSKYLQTDGMFILQAQQMVSSTLEFLKKEARNFEDILKAGKHFVKWANELIENEDEINNLIPDNLPNVRIRKKKTLDGDNQNETVTETAIDLFKFNVHNTAMDTVICKLEQRFAKHAEICSDFTCLDPRQFSKPLPTTALFKLSKVLGLENTSILREEFLDFTKKWDKLKLNLPEVYASYRSDEENELPELDLECLQENEFEQNLCKTNKRCLNCFLCCFNVLFKYRLYVKAYSNLFLAYMYILTLSCTQVGCEKSFSTLCFIKNRLRNRLSMENLDAWMLMHLNKDILETLTHENIIEEMIKHSSVFKKMLVV